MIKYTIQLLLSVNIIELILESFLEQEAVLETKFGIIL